MGHIFPVLNRNGGNRTFFTNVHGCSFLLRGFPGEWRAMDERAPPFHVTTFKEQSAAMSFICAELMHELLTVEGQTPHVMESWNISPQIGGAA